MPLGIKPQHAKSSLSTIPGEGRVRRVAACTLRFFSSSVTIALLVTHIQGSSWAAQEKPGEKREKFWFEKRSKNHRIRGAHIARDFGTHLGRSKEDVSQGSQKRPLFNLFYKFKYQGVLSHLKKEF